MTTMDSTPPLAEAQAPNRRTSRLSPSRSRSCYTEIRRREVAETRKLGACETCRGKKTRCFHAQHRTAAGGNSAISSIDTRTISSPIPETHQSINNTSDGNGDKNTAGGVPKKLEGYVEAARAYIKVARSHFEEFERFAEEFERFVECWECQSAGDQSLDGYTSMPQNNGLNMAGGVSECVVSNSAADVAGGDLSSMESRVDRTMTTSAPHKNAWVYKDQDLASSTPKESVQLFKTALGTKDCNRRLSPQLNSTRNATHPPIPQENQSPTTGRRRPRLTGENEPWALPSRKETTQFPQNPSASKPEIPVHKSRPNRRRPVRAAIRKRAVLPSDRVPYTPSRHLLHGNPPSSMDEEMLQNLGNLKTLTSSNATFGPEYPSTTPSETKKHQHQQQEFECPQPSAAHNYGAYGNATETQSNVDLGFSQTILEGLEDPFAVSGMTSVPFLTNFGPHINQDSLPFLLLGEAVAPLHQDQGFNLNINNGSFHSEIGSRTSTSPGVPCLDFTASSSVSQGRVPATPQDLTYTPTRNPSQWQGLGTFWSAEKAADIRQDSSFDDLDFMM